MQTQKILRCAPGLARLLIKEMMFRNVVKKGIRPTILYQRNHDFLFFPRVDNEKAMRDLRLAEDVHECVAFGKNNVTKGLLDKAAQALTRKDSSYRLAVTVDGAHFNRKDMERKLKRELSTRGVTFYENAKETLWAFLIEEKFYLAVQMQEASKVFYRQKRVAEREGSLPPVIAAALIFAGNPKPDEAVFDPVCGSGTLLAEAYAAQPKLKALFGCDIDEEAVRVTRLNTKGISCCEIKQGDGRQSGHADSSIDLGLANLPFGKQYGDVGSNPELYKDILMETRRVLCPGSGRAVFLTSDTDSFKSAAQCVEGLKVEKIFTVKIRGELCQASHYRTLHQNTLTGKGFRGIFCAVKSRSRFFIGL